MAAVALTPALNPAQPFSINLAVIFRDDPLIFCNTARVHPNSFFFFNLRAACLVSLQWRWARTSSISAKFWNQWEAFRNCCAFIECFMNIIRWQQCPTLSKRVFSLHYFLFVSCHFWQQLKVPQWQWLQPKQMQYHLAWAKHAPNINVWLKRATSTNNQRATPQHLERSCCSTALQIRQCVSLQHSPALWQRCAHRQCTTFLLVG